MWTQRKRVHCVGVGDRVQMLSEKLAQLEGTEDALVTGSGMSAISMALLSLLRPGDHLLVQVTPFPSSVDWSLGQIFWHRPLLHKRVCHCSG